ncbi:ComF family protein [Candidatus Uhrbacteria bacterium]|nr:ComF family protein [Candidatus Uhrbacteria bacterium]
MWQWFLEGLFPRLCVRCGKEGADVCPTCFATVFENAPRLACPVCNTYSSIGARCGSCKGALDGLLFCASYADPVVRGLIERWKFSFARTVEESLAQLFSRAPLDRALAGDDWVVVPIPLHAKRKRWRGFNQAEWVARQVGTRLRLPVVQALARTRATTQQARRSAEQKKRGDLSGVFEAAQPVTGRVILCDDVYTSGATMEAAASALKQAGATSVWGVAIARS